MSWSVVARKDFRDGVRARSVWALTAVFVLFATGMAYVYGATDLLGGGEEVTAIGFIGFVQSAGAVLVPIIGLLVGYKAIVGERASGSVKLLLGLPHSRRDVVLGKLVGRTLVVAVPVVVGYLAAGVVGLVTFGEFAVPEFLAFVVLTVAFALSYISIAVGFSSATASESRASAMAIGLWVLFQFGWTVLATLLLWASNGFTLSGLSRSPAWYQLVTQLTPNGGYGMGTLLLRPVEYAAAYDALYLEEWFGLVILAFWIVVPVALGYRRFARADL